MEVIKVFKGTDETGRQVMKARVWWDEEQTEVEGIIGYPASSPVLNVTTKTIFNTLILKLDPVSLDAAYAVYNAAD